MRIVCFVPKASTGATPRLGVLPAGEVHLLDLATAIEAGAEARSLLTWYDLDGPYLPQAVEFVATLGGDVIGNGTRAAPNAIVPLADVRLLAPVPRPGKLICIGLNYRDHAAESNVAVPTTPVTFSKYTTAVIEPAAPVILPAASQQVDYEAELAVVIGRRAKHVPRERAFHHVLGYTNLNDVSARDLQFADKQWQRGKSCDTFAPMGPAVVTTDEIPDPHALRIRLRLNGETMQDSSTSQLIFGVDQLIAFLTETVTLEPGDVIATGTPSGVGFARKPPVYLTPGDIMEVEVEGLGILSNPVLAEGRPSPHAPSPR
jgi:2-keto-4-pentenoate hydratase/2-oxohepta-3-ene-1,7-dioic acid hydratase in catechol pathway